MVLGTALFHRFVLQLGTGDLKMIKVRILLIFIILSILDIITVHSDLLIILLKRSHVLPGLGELSLLHTLPNIPMHKSPFSIHQVKLVVQPGPGLSNSRCVGQHAHSPLYLGQVTARDDGGWLVVDTNLKPSWTPINKLDRSLALDGGNGGVHVLGHHVPSIEHAAGHVLTMSWVTLDHGVSWLKASIGNLCYVEGFVISLLGRDDRGVGDEREVDPWIRNQVGLELVQVDIESSVEPERSSDTAHYLRDETVEVCVRGSVNVQIPPTNVVNCLVIYHEGAVGVLQSSVGTKSRVVGLDHGGGHLGGGVDGELQLGFLAVVDTQPLH